MTIPPLFSIRTDAAPWRAFVEHPLFLGFLLLLPVVWLLGPVPIDETRYLAVAWEMRQTGEFLVPHLNGATYAHKPPMLFWMINVGWLVTGVHAWTARAMTLACSLITLILMQRLTLRLGASESAARHSMWLVLGAIYFGFFANAIMFDVPLTTCVLLAVHGLLDLVEGRSRRGILVTGVAIGLGILLKGPVMLLDIAFVALGAPWWARDALRGRRARYFGVFGLAFLLGVAIGLAWAIPAALHGGDAYARAIFLNQTFDRIEAVKGASAHGRPFWWYAAVFPLMLLPWPLVMRGSWQRLRSLQDDRAVRLGLAWVVPTFVAFSLIGGKQPHYLLPAIPGVALILAVALERGALRVRTGVFGLVLIAVGVAFGWISQHPPSHFSDAYFGDTSVAWAIGIAVIGAAMLVSSRRAIEPAWPALATLAVVLIIKIAIVQGPGERYDVSRIATQIAAAQQRGKPIVCLGWHHGVFEFAGRLKEPLLVIEGMNEFATWTQQHPDGLAVSFYARFRFRATPVFTQPFRGVEVSIWNATEALASGVDPAVEHVRDGGDSGEEATDD
ncbi:MAG: glycosyltransferase family 39 protein [Dokdonella sp.]|uniref:ArnT family glycosyltransferase n=1 Tax=Dokdonella sp. TaxID=2291710 RepID=UPI003264089D